MKLNRSKKGFTLVEIMIVVVIIGLLAAMAIPAFQKVRKNSLAKTVVNDARQLAGGAQQLLLQYPDTVNPIVVTYTNTSGVITSPTPASAPANTGIQSYVQKIGKGYVAGGGTISYNTEAPAGTAAFTLNLPGVGPADFSSTNTVTNGPVQFDTEGKPL